jgi:hypothetical protein
MLYYQERGIKKMKDFDKKDGANIVEEFLAYLRTLPHYEGLLILNVGEARKMRKAYDMLVDYAIDASQLGIDNIEVLLPNPNLTYDCYGISIKSDRLEFSNIEKFTKMAQLASIIEIFPLIDDRVQLDFSFNNIFVRADRVGVVGANIKPYRDDKSSANSVSIAVGLTGNSMDVDEYISLVRWIRGIGNLPYGKAFVPNPEKFIHKPNPFNKGTVHTFDELMVPIDKI